MSRNMGTTERLARIILGVMIPLGTALTGHCPFYAALGWNRGVRREL